MNFIFPVAEDFKELVLEAFEGLGGVSVHDFQESPGHVAAKAVLPGRYCSVRTVCHFVLGFPPPWQCEIYDRLPGVGKGGGGDEMRGKGLYRPEYKNRNDFFFFFCFKPFFLGSDGWLNWAEQQAAMDHHANPRSCDV